MAKTITYKKFGRTVIDATKDLTVRVKEVDVKNAVPCDYHHCGYANAIRRVTGAKWVEVRNVVVYLGIGDEEDKVCRRYHLDSLSQEARQFFDKSRVMGPANLILRAPIERKIGSRKGEKGGYRSKAKSRPRAQPTR